jgi:hypothetical protein
LSILKKNEAYREKASEINRLYQEARKNKRDLEKKIEALNNIVFQEMPYDRKKTSVNPVHEDLSFDDDLLSEAGFHKIFSDYGRLDRNSPIDKSKRIFKDLRKVYERIIHQDLQSKLEEYYGDKESDHLM